MRTTLTLDDELAQAIDRLQRQRGDTFKAVVNELLRRGLQADREPVPYESPVFASGARPGVDFDRALSLVGDQEDAEAVRKLEMGK